MKHLIWLPAAALVGFLVGSWGTHAELRTKEDQMEKKLAQQRRSDANAFNSFAKMVNIPEEAKRRRPRRKAERGPADARSVRTAPTNSAMVADAAVPATTNLQARSEPPPRRFSPRDLQARIDEAQDLWRTRGEMVKAKWKEKLGLDAKGAEKFDAALADMNEQLRTSMQALAERIAQNERMTPELTLRLMGDTTTIMAETYDRLGECVGAERRGEVSELQVFELIDPGVAEPLISVQDKLEGLRFHGDGE